MEFKELIHNTDFELKAIDGFKRYSLLRSLINKNFNEQLNYDNLKPLYNIITNIPENEIKLFVFSEESVEIDVIVKNKGQFSIEYYYDDNDNIIISTYKADTLTIECFNINDYNKINEFIKE